MNNIITYTKEVPTFKIIYGGLILIAGVGMFVKGSIVFGSVLFFIGLHLISTEGSQIDLDSKTYRTTKVLFGQHIGKWQPCPAFEYVSVFSTRENQTVNVISASATMTSEVILLNLFYDKNKHQTFYKTTNKADAFRVADHFKLVFGIDILDATGSEKKWL